MIFIGSSSSGFTFVSQYSVESRTLNPVTDAGGVANEVMVVSIMSDGALLTPAGWTQIAFVSNDGLNRGIFYKKLNGTETSSINFSAAAFYVGLHALRFTTTASSFSSGSVVSGYSSSGNPVNSSITVSSLTDPCIVLGIGMAYDDSAAFTSLTTFSLSPAETTQYDLLVAANFFCISAVYKIYNTAPSDTTIDIGDEAGDPNGLYNGYLGCYLKET